MGFEAWRESLDAERSSTASHGGHLGWLGYCIVLSRLVSYIFGCVLQLFMVPVIVEILYAVVLDIPEYSIQVICTCFWLNYWCM